MFVLHYKMCRAIFFSGRKVHTGHLWKNYRSIILFGCDLCPVETQSSSRVQLFLFPVQLYNSPNKTTSYSTGSSSHQIYRRHKICLTRLRICHIRITHVHLLSKLYPLMWALRPWLSPYGQTHVQMPRTGAPSPHTPNISFLQQRSPKTSLLLTASSLIFKPPVS